jgi:hypothetical protein
MIEGDDLIGLGGVSQLHIPPEIGFRLTDNRLGVSDGTRASRCPGPHRGGFPSTTPEEADEAESAETSAGPPTATAAKALLCERISTHMGVRVVKLIKFEGKHPTYHMYLTQGIIEFASVDKLVNYRSVRTAIAAKVGRIIRKITPDHWESIAQMLLDACFIEECTEDGDVEDSARALLIDYLREADFIPSIEGQRIQDQRRPMIAGGRITVCSSDFADCLNETKGMALSPKRAASILRAVGAKKTDKFRNTRLNRQSRWWLPAAEFNPAQMRSGITSQE